jgi:DNA-binding LytR/AlgR family response regulator
MKGLVESLPEDKFMRVHKSFIISTDRISAISRNQVMIGEKWIPIGENYRDAFRKRILNKPV